MDAIRGFRSTALATGDPRRIANDALGRLIKVAGGQSALARFLSDPANRPDGRLPEDKGRSQSAISKRYNLGKALWEADVLIAEARFGISRHELRPDIYPIESDPPGPSSRPAEPAAARTPSGVAAGQPSPLAGLRP